MINFNLYICFLLLIITTISSAQNYQATYLVKLDQKRKSSYIEELNEKKSKDLSSISLIRQLEQKQPVKAVLLFNKNKSVYKVLDHLNRDDLNFSGFLKAIAGGDDIYFNTLDNQFKLELMEGEKNYVSKKRIDWQISNQTKTINDQSCRMAFDKNNPSVQAWFNENLGLPFGPLHFFGLPGLIYEVDYMYFEFKLINLAQTKENISIPKNVEIISPTDFYDKYNIKNPFIKN